MKRLIAAIIILFFSAPVFAIDEGSIAFSVGDTLPNITIYGLADYKDYETLLGRTDTGSFDLGLVEGEVLVLELFNRFCMSCWEQAPIMESIWERLGEENLRGRVKLLGLAEGNTESGVLQFKEEKGLTYPLGADPSFSALDTIGDSAGTPLTLLLKRVGDVWELAYFHIGVLEEEALYAGIESLLAGEAVSIKVEQGIPAFIEEEPEELFEAQQREEVEILFTRIRGGEVTKAERVEGLDAFLLFRAYDGEGNPLDLYGRVAKRRPVCDLCHTNVFVFAFDSEGRVRGFDVLYATKLANDKWSAEDTRSFESRLIAKDKVIFNPDTDAVTTATMSSSLMYDEVRRTLAALPELK
ncbi:MAG: hypothetical protein C0609_07505 [Deltaproteobacteria bacterium]|nr:MAG: hypothetical protein C0609_07505 [Deltaproteobacteria bacterium]